MIIFYEQHRQFLRTLTHHNVAFIVIGGYAVNYHGFNPGDMDIWLKPDNENKSRLVAALITENFSEETIRKVESLDFRRTVFFFFGTAPLRIDFLTKISGVDFEEALKQKELIKVDHLSVPVLNLNHLILSKISNGRTKDKLDVEELQKVSRISKGQ